jgi:D-alanine-D-alanine ligase
MVMYVAVVNGGNSSEAEISRRSSSAVCKALSELGIKHKSIEFDKNIAANLVGFDAVYNAMHGKFGEDGCVPAVCEILGLPYTHSGVKSSAIAMDKIITKQLLQDKVVMAKSYNSLSEVESFPVVIKPASEGSSVGVRILQQAEELPNGYMIEQYIKGLELSCMVLNDKAYSVIEIRPEGWYDYTNKYNSTTTQYIVPANIPASVAEQVQQMAEIAHNRLGCRTISRSDFILGEDGKAYFLEINTHPGMTEKSLCPKIANYHGISYATLVQTILDGAKNDA